MSDLHSAPRLGLCCTFANEPALKFRTTTAAHLARLAALENGEANAIAFYRQLVTHNLTTLANVITWCRSNNVRAFRINSDLWPRATHAIVKPWIHSLFEHDAIQQQFAAIKREAAAGDVRLSEHPDQFLVGNSLRADVVQSTVNELEWRGKLGDALGVDVICLHAGSGAPDRESALWRWEETLARLSPSVLSKLAFENDDRTFSPEQILPACMHWNLPMIYDVHHHRSLTDALTVEEATEFAMASWGDREPYFHLSSPRRGWNTGDTRPHHDFIELADWPEAWTALWQAAVPFTVDIEAKAKELAVFGLRSALVSSRLTHPLQRQHDSFRATGTLRR